MWILFPNQLFSEEQLKHIPQWKKETYILWEDPLFYGIRPDSKAFKGSLKLNKLRIIYQKWLWLNYIEYLKSLHLTVHIQPYESLLTASSALEHIKQWQKKGPLQCFDPEDAVLKKRWSKISIEWNDSPMFLMTSNKIQSYYASLTSNKRLQHGHFYDYMKQEVLTTYFPSIKIPTSKDTENRKPFPSKETLPKLPYSNESKQLPILLQKASEWCETHFSKNPGPENLTEALQKYLVHLPSNSKEAKQWWINYRTTRFAKFGPYEDAIVSEQPIMYHSFSAMLLNFGLLTPREILKDIFEHFSFQSSSKELVSTLEGFVRQIAGWREYSRLYYRVVLDKEYRKNIFEHTQRLSKEWYTPTTSNRFPSIVQEAIRDAWNTGYLHHIRRLMVVSNYMNLSYIHPEQMYKWMYEFSLDSWEWVMVFNVYSMGAWSDGGLAMRKPYVSSSAYLLKMSNTSSGPWVQEWKDKYTQFLKRHTNILKHTIYAYQLRKL